MRKLAFVVATAVVAVAACTAVNAPDDPVPAVVDSTGGGTPEGCPEGFEVCSSACLRTQIDPQNCGSCGNACADGEVCGLGQCLTECPDGTTPCGGSCVDVQTDAAHCGECDNACPAADNETASCTDGMCGRACNAGFDNCDGVSFNGCEQEITGDDANHCGSCTNICVAKPHSDPGCSGGSCVLGACEMNFDNCDTDPSNGCETDLRSTAAHCTACNTPCPAGVAGYCEQSVCQLGFSQSFTNEMSRPAGVCDAWNAFRASLVGGSFASVTVRGSQDTVGRTCTDPTTATQICLGLAAGSLAAVSCGGFTWKVGNCISSTELNVDGTGFCLCSGNYVVRPCINDPDWGGINTPVCNPGNVSQTMEVICRPQ